MSDAHEKTRVRHLEEAAAHWEHKYTNARQYNRNLEERIAALEAENARLRKALTIIASYTGHDSAAWAAKEMARGALQSKTESK